MHNKRESYSRKRKHKNDWDEGERRRGKSRKETEEAKIRKAMKQEEKINNSAESIRSSTASYRPQSLRPPEKLQVKKPIYRTPEEIRLIKEDISRRFREGLKNDNGRTE